MTRPLLQIALLTMAGACAGGRSALRDPATGREASGDPRQELQRLEQRLQAARTRAGMGGSADAAERPAAAPVPAQESLGERPPGGRCEAVCRAGRDICGYSGRICLLAAELGDADSRRSCERARADCAEAERSCQTCR